MISIINKNKIFPIRSEKIIGAHRGAQGGNGPLHGQKRGGVVSFVRPPPHEKNLETNLEEISRQNAKNCAFGAMSFVFYETKYFIDIRLFFFPTKTFSFDIRQNFSSICKHFSSMRQIFLR